MTGIVGMGTNNNGDGEYGESVTVTAKMPTSFADDLDAAARQRLSSRSAILREIVAEWREKYRKAKASE